MTSFLNINRHKLTFAFKATSGIFTLIIFTIIIIIGLTKNNYPNLDLLIIVILSASIGFPIFILGLAYIEWLSKRRVRKKALEYCPFDQLDKIGFTVSYLHEKTKWYFTEVTKEIKINGYRIQVDTKRESPKTLEFKVFVQSPEIDEEAFKRLETKLKQDDIYFDFDGPVKKYNLKRPINLTAEQLKTDLTKFVEILKNEKFESTDRQNGRA